MARFLLYLLAIAGFKILSAQKPDIGALDSALKKLHATNRFNGAVLYAENGVVVYKKAYGIEDFRTGRPLSVNSSFNLASVTKQFVCMAILLLKDKGLLDIDDSIRKYIPELPYKGITIRHLMTHTSGIPEYFNWFQRYRTPLDTLTNAKLINLFATQKPMLDFVPGTQWQYVNTNYALLVSIIERVSGQSFPVFFRERIAVPLQLKSTYVYHALMRTVPPNQVVGFKETGEGRKLQDLTVFDGVTGDGNIYSSVEDLFLWEQSLYTEKLVKKKTLSEAFQPVKLYNGNTHPYGFGWRISEENPGVFEHIGGWVGFTNIIFRDTVKKTVLIVLSSGGNWTGPRLARDCILGKSPEIAETFLIKNVQLIDGSGASARHASVRMEGKRILAVGDLTPFPGEKVADGEGNILAPGFIDTHSHLYGSLKKYPEALAALSQGVTTIISGQDGGSLPVDSIKAQMKQTPTAIHVATYTGHATIREKVMGSENLSRPATEAEIEKIKELLKDDLQKGSLGLSTGLEYENGFYSNRHEVIELAKVAAAEKARYVSHIRSEDVQMEDAIDEIIAIGKEARIPVLVSHIKIALKDDWGKASELLARFQQARSEGIDITADCYPYDFWNSTIRVLFPLKNFESLAGAQFAVDHLFDPAGSVITRFAPDTTYKGKTVSEISGIRKESPAQTLLYLIAAAEAYQKQYPEASGVEGIMGKAMDEKDIEVFLAWPHTNICSDGSNSGHPRGWGSYTRVLNRFVKEKKILSWESAIHKMTGLAAEQSGITGRGLIVPGFIADLVLLDPRQVRDNASIQNPQAMSDGILKVWVNGELVFQNKTFLGKYPGEFVGR